MKYKKLKYVCEIMMASNKVYEQYLEKHGIHPALIEAKPDSELEAILIIPSFYEDKIIDTLKSLLNAVHSGRNLEVIVVLNHSQDGGEHIIDFHKNQYSELTYWMNKNSNNQLKFHCTKPIIFKPKLAGVGAARKAGMDEAIRRFNLINQDQGIIINTDADCLLHEDYWNTILDYYQKENSKACVNLNFEHRYDEIPELKEAIISYELHLLYYVLAQRWIQYPYAYQTIGSSFAVTAIDYCKQGGMNQRQAGEDFYFINKFSVIGQLDDLDKVLVYPSSRKSLRVPFGTGKAIYKYEELNQQLTYNLEAIELFGNIIKFIPSCYESDEYQIKFNNLNQDAYQYFKKEGLLEEIELCKKNCSNLKTFSNRLMKWFNPFRLMKFLHYMRDHNYPDHEVQIESKKLLHKLDQVNIKDLNSFELLNRFKNINVPSNY